MNHSAKKENSRSLAAMMGLSDGEASELLEATAVVTFRDDDVIGKDIATQVVALLSRTLSDVSVDNVSGKSVAVELVIGATEPRHATATVWISVEKGRIIISRSRGNPDSSGIHPIGRLIGACYSCAAALKAVIGDRLNQPTPETYVVDITELLGDDEAILDQEVLFDEAFLAGAGAIGNGFVLGLSRLPISGKMHVVDDDHVSEGNLQRCILFNPEHVNGKKAVIVAAVGSRLSPKITYLPRVMRVQDLPEKRRGAWLKRLVVGVDSPRARRSLQGEMPREVFDASTTGSAEIVFHYHIQPTEHACMACVYPLSPDEDAHSRHVAESLGVTHEEVCSIKVSSLSAEKILAKHPHLTRDNVIGVPYDTLFKALCSSDKLFAAEGRDVLTPFAFISVLAGAMLSLEFFRRVHRGHVGKPNLWRVSPWSNPLLRNRRLVPRNPACEFCGREVLRNLMNKMWNNSEPN